MTDYEMRIKLAELDGYTFREIDNWPGFYSWHDRNGRWTGRALFGGPRSMERAAEWLPDYVGDMAQMMALADRLVGQQHALRECYLDNLALQVLGEGARCDGSYREQWAMTQASARGRGLALLAAFGQHETTTQSDQHHD